MLKIAIYGKGGIGKSTTACNLSAALVERGEKVFQVGCSPKIDSTVLLNNGEVLEPDILTKTKMGPNKQNVLACIKKGYGGVMIAESGGPEPATGCAGRGVASTLDLLAKYKIFSELGITVAIFDVLGDVVCGGFAKPMESGFAENIYIVTSGELMAIYATNNLFNAVNEIRQRKPGVNLKVGGIINNMRGVENEKLIVEEFARRWGVKVLAHVPRSKTIQEAEDEGGTVIEKKPDSELSTIYRRLADKVLNQELVVPKPLKLEEVLGLMKQYSGTNAKLEINTVSTSDNTKVLTDWSDKGRREKILKKIAIYGKGGIGKSTTSSNISVALSKMGEKVLQLGCDPKRDSIATVCGKLMPTILDTMREHGGEMTEEIMGTLVHKGYNSVLGMESGGPRPGVGCGGAGVMESLRQLEKFEVLKQYDITFALFDVLGDVVCGGFAQPMRAGYAQEVYIVTCGELLTLIQINNIARSIRKMHDQGIQCACGGIINNMRGVNNEERIVEAVAQKMRLPVIQHIPRSQTVQDAEFYTRTVIEMFPESSQAEVYKSLAQKILHNKEVFVPNPLTVEEIRKIVKSFS